MLIYLLRQSSKVYPIRNLVTLFNIINRILFFLLALMNVVLAEGLINGGKMFNNTGKNPFTIIWKSSLWGILAYNSVGTIFEAIRLYVNRSYWYSHSEEDWSLLFNKDIKTLSTVVLMISGCYFAWEQKYPAFINWLQLSSKAHPKVKIMLSLVLSMGTYLGSYFIFYKFNVTPGSKNKTIKHGNNRQSVKKSWSQYRLK